MKCVYILWDLVMVIQLMFMILCVCVCVCVRAFVRACVCGMHHHVYIICIYKKVKES